MDVKAAHVYPNCPTVIRTVMVGGRTKSELLEELQRNVIALNELGERLFASKHFTTSPTRCTLTTIELTVHDLGCPQGATITEIYARAKALDLTLCPIELGPHLRLQYLDQPEGHWGKPIRQNQAPYGSITIASEQRIEADGFPKGFYLRRIKGALWLRGYCSGSEHVWEPDDHFIFVAQART